MKMRNPFGRIWEVLRSPNYSRTLSMLALLIVAAAVPLTVYIAQQQQEIRQRASEGETFAIGGRVVDNGGQAISNVKILVYIIVNGRDTGAGDDVREVLTPDSNGSWTLSSPDVLKTDSSFEVWPQCIGNRLPQDGVLEGSPAGLNCDPKALSSTGKKTFETGDYYESSPTNRLSNLMAFDFMYTRSANPRPPPNKGDCSNEGQACRTSGTTDVCCGGLECDASSPGSATGTCKSSKASTKITVGGEVKNDDGVGIDGLHILVSIRHTGYPGVADDNSIIAETHSGGKWSATSPELGDGDTVSIWPQCVSGLDSMKPYDLPGYICDGTQGPATTNSFAKSSWPGTTDFPHKGDFYNITPTNRSGNLTDFGFVYARETAANPTPTNVPFCSKEGEACRTSGTNDICCSGLECDASSVGSATGTCRKITNPTPPPSGCTNNSECSLTQACSGGSCVAVTCLLNNTDCATYNVNNHTCEKNNKADGTACASGGTCQNGDCTHAGDTILSLKLNLTGIGGTGGNPNPLHPQRDITLCLYGADADKKSAGDKDCANASYKISGKQISFDKTSSPSGKFTTSSISGNVVTGPYSAFVKVGKYLRKRLTGFQNIISGTPYYLPEETLNVGDIKEDNKLDILDYGILVSCFGDKADTSSCGANNKDLSDLNDDGKVGDVDYSLFINSLSVQEGD